MLHYAFDWSVLWRHPYGQWVLNGILTTIHLSLLSLTIGMVLGVLIAVCRLAPFRLSRLVGCAYVQLFRNVPLLVQMFFWYFAVPCLLPSTIAHWLNHDVRHLGYFMGVLCLGTYTASRVAETVRSGVLAVPSGIYRAALSTGLTPRMSFLHVVIPYALRLVIPLLSTEILSCFKSSALTMTIGVMETTGVAGHIDSITFHGLETTTASSLVYLAITIFVMTVMGRVEDRMRFPGMIQKGR